MANKKLLLHTCCAPCLTVPAERLEADYDVTCFFYNPNIHPYEEYTQRLHELRDLANRLKLEIIIPEYDWDRWFARVKGLEHEPEGGKRCAICFELRLQKTAQFAQDTGFDFFTTTLTISPHKNAWLINQIGLTLGEQYQVKFAVDDFKKKDGYQRSIQLSKIYNLYRQNYCGCLYSRRK